VNNQHYQSRGPKKNRFFAISELEEGITLSTPFFGNQIRVIIVCIKKHP
jgi:hypothetical protein